VNKKKVSISFNPESGRLLVRPKVVALDAGRRQEVLWRCRTANLEIRFAPEETPFVASRWRCSKGGGCLSGVPKKRRGQEKFVKYTVTVLNQPNGAGGQAAATAKGAKDAKKAAGRKAPVQEQAHCAPVVKEAFLLLQ
jgi:hypothetical protein